MNVNILFLFAIFLQVSGQNEVGFPQQLETAQVRIRLSLNTMTARYKMAEVKLKEDVKSWYIPSPQLQQAFDETLREAKGFLDKAEGYAQGSERLLKATGVVNEADWDPEWVTRVRQLQDMTEKALLKTDESLSFVEKYSVEVTDDQKAYVTAKELQVVSTKKEMDDSLDTLLHQTLQVGQQARGVLAQAVNDWKVVLRKYLDGNAEPEIEKITILAEPVLADLSRLRPEDIDTTMADAHHCVEDVKSLFHALNIPNGVVRQVINPVQLGVFAILTRAKNISYQRPHISRR